MEQYDLQQQLQQANELIKKAQSDVGKTQSLDEASLEQAHEQLQQAEFHLEDVQKKLEEKQQNIRNFSKPSNSCITCVDK